MSTTTTSANDALRKLKGFSGKSSLSSRSATSSTRTEVQKHKTFDSDPIQTSLASGQLDIAQDLEDAKYENIRLNIENNVISQIDGKIESIRSTQQNWHGLLIAIICGITFVAWLFWQGKFDSLTERLIKLESIISLTKEMQSLSVDNQNQLLDKRPNKNK